METYSYISENGEMREIADLNARNVNATQNGRLDAIEETIATIIEDEVYPKKYKGSGNIINEQDGNMRGVGFVNVTLYKNKEVEIEGTFQIVTSGASATNFRCGINRDLIKILIPTLPNITPKKGGVLIVFDATTNTYKKDYLQYGGTLETATQFWTFARVYTTSGAVGAYPSNTFHVGETGYFKALGTWSE